MATYGAGGLIEFQWLQAIDRYINLEPDVTPLTVNDSDTDTTFETGDTIQINSSSYNYAGFLTVPLVGGGTIDLPFFNITNDTAFALIPPGLTSAEIGVEAGDMFFPLTVLNSAAFTACFAAGSLIATPDGERTVEDLGIGDSILTAGGRTVPVKWVGRQTVWKLRHRARSQPVRIRAGALGGGLPHRDLTVTADHGMVLDGYVINASALVNHDTINFVPLAELGDVFTVYHIETEAHDVILANGTPAETFIDYAGRAAFDNHDEYLSLYGADRIIAEMPQPRISSARHVPQVIRQRLGIDTAQQLDLAEDNQAALSGI